MKGDELTHGVNKDTRRHLVVHHPSLEFCIAHGICQVSRQCIRLS